MNQNLKSDRHLLATLWVVFGTLGRLLPHAPNMTPMTSIALFSGSQIGRLLSYAVAFATMILSDIALAKMNGYPAFGTWSIFTYTGFAAIILAGNFLSKAPSAGRTLAYLLGSSLGFWLWTNFGIWATGDHGMYTLTLNGLVECYVAALPFLRNALVGDLAWGLVLFLGFQGVKKLAPRYGYATA